MMMSIIGGALIGAAAGALFLTEGRIAGVSGMVARGLDPTESDRAWRLLFVAALAAGGAVVDGFLPGALPRSYGASTTHLVAAGVLVGIGARLANGCTSGHALCGVARFSKRSLVACATFMALGMATVLVLKELGGGIR